MFKLFAYIPNWVNKLFPTRVWKSNTKRKEIVLTFDDGPTPEITDWVLNLLEKNNIQAIFFVIGKNAEQNPLLLKRIKENGHLVANHTYNHNLGWKTSTETYIESVNKTKQFCTTNYFRPPYGKATNKQIKKLKENDFKTIMWSVLSYDFHPKISPLQSFNLLKKHTKPGSIIVFHDSEKAFKILQDVLPKFLYWAKNNNYIFTLDIKDK